MKKFTKISAAIIATLAFANLANAATPGAYAGIGLGYSELRTQNLLSNGITTSSSHDVGGLGGRIFGGYNFNKYAGIEANYAMYASSTYKATYLLLPTSANVQQKNSLSALSVVGKGYLPINDSGFNAYVLGGLAEVRSQLRGTSNLAPTTTTNTSALRPVYGIGGSYDFAQHITTSVELSRIQGKGDLKTNAHAIPNADMISLNLGYNFG